MKTEYDAARLIYNRFRSAIAYKPTIATVLSPDVRSHQIYLHSTYTLLQFMPCGQCNIYSSEIQTQVVFIQAMEKELAAGGALDTYEFEGPDRPELVQDLAEFQLAAVRIRPLDPCSCLLPTSSKFTLNFIPEK